MNGATNPVQGAGTGTLIDFVAARRGVRERSANTVEPFEAQPTDLPHASTESRKQDPAALERAQIEAEAEFVRLIQSTDDEAFEAGVENELSLGIERMIQQYGPQGVYAIGSLYLSGTMSPTMLAEALPWLGQVEDDTTHEPIYWFLVYCLRDGHPWVRSSAALGLASMEDSRAAPYLRREARTESIRLLQSRLQKVADELASL
jgi:hypothetical protein